MRFMNTKYEQYESEHELVDECTYEIESDLLTEKMNKFLTPQFGCPSPGSIEDSRPCETKYDNSISVSLGRGWAGRWTLKQVDANEIH